MRLRRAVNDMTVGLAIRTLSLGSALLSQRFESESAEHVAANRAGNEGDCRFGAPLAGLEQDCRKRNIRLDPDAATKFVPMDLRDSRWHVDCSSLLQWAHCGPSKNTPRTLRKSKEFS